MKYLYGFVVVFVLIGTVWVSDLQAQAPAGQSAQSGPAKKPDQPEAYDINYSYDPGNRRDPFISLLEAVKKPTAPRGALTVADAKLVGITQGKEGYVAIIMGTDNKARFMKVGDKLFDGEIIGIEPDKVIFRQDITDDVLAAPGLKSREVTKRLHPVEEGT